MTKFLTIGWMRPIVALKTEREVFRTGEAKTNLAIKYFMLNTTDFMVFNKRSATFVIYLNVPSN